MRLRRSGAHWKATAAICSLQMVLLLVFPAGLHYAGIPLKYRGLLEHSSSDLQVAELTELEDCEAEGETCNPESANGIFYLPLPLRDVEFDRLSSTDRSLDFGRKCVEPRLARAPPV